MIHRLIRVMLSRESNPEFSKSLTTIGERGSIIHGEDEARDRDSHLGLSPSSIYLQ